MIDLKQFTKDATRTESIIDGVEITQQYVVAILTIIIEAAELLDQIKKHVFYGKPIDEERRKFATEGIEFGLKNLTSTNPFDNVRPSHVDPRMFHHIIGIITESGELAEQLKMHLAQHQPLDLVNIAEECGDVNWYVACLMDATGNDFETVLNKIIAKLKLRYPDKFDSDKAINRNLDAERELLERE